MEAGAQTTKNKIKFKKIYLVLKLRDHYFDVLMNGKSKKKTEENKQTNKKELRKD